MLTAPGASNGAQYWDCTPDDTLAVSRFAPNGYGLFDMIGNVWYWVNDWYDFSFYVFSPGSNPMGLDTGTGKVVRGGSWGSLDDDLRVSTRNAFPGVDIGKSGFRCTAPPGR